MSAPDTNIEKQERRHSASLLGIRGVLVFAAIMMLLWGGYGVVKADEDASAFKGEDAATEQTTAVPTDVYEPGTNKSSTPVEGN